MSTRLSIHNADCAQNGGAVYPQGSLYINNNKLKKSQTWALSTGNRPALCCWVWICRLTSTAHVSSQLVRGTKAYKLLQCIFSSIFFFLMWRIRSTSRTYVLQPLLKRMNTFFFLFFLTFNSPKGDFLLELRIVTFLFMQ